MSLNYATGIPQHQNHDYLEQSSNFLSTEIFSTSNIGHYHELAMKIIKIANDLGVCKKSSLNTLKYCAVNGHLRSQTALATFYWGGTLVEHDLDQALFWADMAAESGNQQMQFFLSQLDQPGTQTKEAKKRLSFQIEKYKNWNSK